MSRWIKVYDREARELVTKEEYSKRQAERAKPCAYELPQKFERGRWKYVKGTRQFVKITEAPKLQAEVPHIQTDEIPPTMSHATDEGLIFTSRSKLMAHYKQHGMVAKEKGMFERLPEAPKPDPRQIREDAAKALNDLRWGNVPLTEREKECTKREQRALEDYKRRMH